MYDAILRCTLSHLRSGFVYRHTAAGPPTEGLYAFYDISTELGKGSFATVMKAVSRTTGEWFAVKMINDNKNLRNGEPAGNNTNAARTTSFAREISIMEKLKHPNIIELKEVFFQENNDISASLPKCGISFLA
jgi:serine/threonine/tyrosine protein kinase RAD53